MELEPEVVPENASGDRERGEGELPGHVEVELVPEELANLVYLQDLDQVNLEETTDPVILIILENCVFVISFY